MKKIIFIGLLSLSLCFSTPVDNTDKSAEKPAVPTKPADVPPPPPSPPADNKNSSSDKPPSSQPPNPVPDAVNGTATGSTGASPNNNNTITPAGNSTDTPAGTNSNATQGTNATPGTNVTPGSNSTSGNSTDGNKKDKPDQTPPANTSTNTTNPAVLPPKHEDKKAEASEQPPVVQGRSFDGPSFIGGIILTLGLLAISFMGFKYYKNQTERNYHTL